MGAGSRLVDVRRGRGRSGCRWSATSRYDDDRHARADRAAPGRTATASRRAASSSPRRSSASTTAPARPTCSPATRRRSPGASRPASRGSASREARAGPSGAFPDRQRYEEMVRTVQGAHRRGRRLPVRPVAARRAADVRHAARRLPRPAPRQPLPVPLPPRSRRARAGRLLPRAPRRLRGRPRAASCPIAGTTEPTEGDVERLLSSEKDRAEHVMLVDLGRNDLSRVCRAGTVHVARSMEVERFSHVSHLVSEVVGELRDGVTPFDVLRACFPAGTVSGAPKIRAMQLISELEGFRRGPYGGAVLYALPGRHDGRMHRAPDDGDARRRRLPPGGRRDRRRLRPCGGARGVPAQARRARGGDRPGRAEASA